MRVIHARNVHQALPEAIRLLATDGVRCDSRNGPVLQLEDPVTTCYLQPCERVLFWPERDANPTFHLMEALWMLAGRNDVEFPTRFVKRMRTFSDDGKTFNGAYGHRWRQHFNVDQLATVAKALRENPRCRRQVVTMWDPRRDLGLQSVDLPCNTHLYFQRSPTLGQLNMLVTCRSNDIIWGCYGANAVHMSILQEFMAAWIGCEVGQYWQVSMNWHAYLDTFDPLRPLGERADDRLNRTQWCPYMQDVVQFKPLVSVPVDRWQQELIMLLDEGPVPGITDPFLRRIVGTMLRAHAAYSQEAGAVGAELAQTILVSIKEPRNDWILAAYEWYARRKEAWNKQNG